MFMDPKTRLCSHFHQSYLERLHCELVVIARKKLRIILRACKSFSPTNLVSLACRKFDGLCYLKLCSKVPQIIVPDREIRKTSHQYHFELQTSGTAKFHCSYVLRAFRLRKSLPPGAPISRSSTPELINSHFLSFKSPRPYSSLYLPGKLIYDKNPLKSSRSYHVKTDIKLKTIKI